MNRIIYVLMCVPVFATGCDQSARNAPPVATPASTTSAGAVTESMAETSSVAPPHVTADEVAQKSKETLDLAGDLAAQTKDEFVAEAKVRLVKMDEKLHDWEAHSKTLAGDAKVKWDEECAKLRAHRAEMQKELDRVQAASGEAWDDLKVGATSAWKNMSDAFGKAADHFNQETAESPK